MNSPYLLRSLIDRLEACLLATKSDSSAMLERCNCGGELALASCPPVSLLSGDAVRLPGCVPAMRMAIRRLRPLACRRRPLAAPLRSLATAPEEFVDTTAGVNFSIKVNFQL
jgi:hypothetical protein